MKNTIILLLALTTITLAVVCVTQSRKSATHQTQMAALEAEVQARSQQIEDLQAAQKRAERQRREATDQAEELAAQLQARQAVETNTPATASAPAAAEPEKPATDTGGFGNMLSKMMQDPDTRKFIRDQQRMMMDQLYAPLVKQMGLTPEEATQFKDLLANNAMKAAEKATSVFGDLASTNRAEVLKTMAAEQKGFDDQLKAFLGDARYAQYKDYQETVGDRTMLNQFKQQAGSDYNLTDPQTEALLTFMKEERKNVASSTGLPLGESDKDPAKMEALISDEKIDQLMQAQDSVNQRVHERARTILSTEQLDTLGKFQTNQMQMMRMSMSMAKKMFAPGNANAAGGTAGP